MEENDVNCNINELILLLKQEKLLISSEKNEIKNLHEKLRCCVDNLAQAAWINTHQRLNLNSLILAKPDYSPSYCAHQASSLPKTLFVQAKDVLGYRVALNFGTFLQELRYNPSRLAHWTVIGEKITDAQWKFPNILHSFVTGLYGSCLLPEDTDCMLQFLKELAKLQVARYENPQRMLKQRSCSFAKMYYLFHEELAPAKHFLCALLQTPVLQLISDTDSYLDIDPDETYTRYSTKDLQENCCNGDVCERMDENVAIYRKRVVSKLVEWTNNVITSLQENIDCFPSSLSWLVRKIADMLSEKYGENSKEVNTVISDLIFTRFICPAIINPEEYGIFDAPVVPSARHNLIQLGKILQMLALIKFENPDPKLMDLYSCFDPGIIQNILCALLPDRKLIKETPPTEKIAAIQKGVVLFTQQELHNLVAFLQNVLSKMLQEQPPSIRSESLEQLSVLLSTLPSSNENSPKNTRQTYPPESSPKRNIFSKVTKSTLTRSFSASNSIGTEPDEFLTGPTTVLIIPIQREEEKPVGLLPEQKVLDMKSELSKEIMGFSVNDPSTPEINATHEKRTRFMISHDEGSIGNTSDNLEAISEAASNHSVASSLELENEDQNDNLSDMVSANVSGRGTPNISGRDTPSSQVNENDERTPEVRQQFLAQPQPVINKQIRTDIDDKFCKFEIKKLLQGDETVSIISDTWSTDVLASDSETIDANDGRQEQIFTPIVGEQSMPNALLDISETHSESAWSTDVLTSDTERLTEVDNDDIASIARSDDASSVARSDDVTRSEGDENLNPDQVLPDRRLSNPSYQYVNNLENFVEFRRQENVQRRNSSGKTDAFVDGNANNILSSVYTRVCRERTVVVEALRTGNERRCSDISQEVLRNSNLEGSSRLSKPQSANQMGTVPPTYLFLRNIETKYEETPNDIKLSNCSLNSNSSASSSGSSGSGGNKNALIPKQWLNSSENSLNVTSTPSESTSELSVLSANTLISPVNIPFINKKAATLNIRSLKPSTSTGAIPKSISFDVSAEKGDKDADEDGKCKRGSFFGKLKIGFRNRRGKSFREEYNNVRFDCGDDDAGRVKRIDLVPKASNAEISDNILAKYRAKGIADKSVCRNEKPAREIDVTKSGLQGGNPLQIDSDALFQDAKKKLRHVLSNSHTLYVQHKRNQRGDFKSSAESFLNQEIARARSLNQWSVAARASEALRCVRLLDSSVCNELFKSLKKDYLQRSLYTQYLLHSRQILLSAQAYLDIIQEQIECDRTLCESYRISTCVQLFLEKYEGEVINFCDEFRQQSLADEKYDLLLNFLHNLHSLMSRESMWTEIRPKNLVVIAVERIIINKVYEHALYPNGDGDRDRDRVLSEHVRKLSRVITPNHKDLQIPKQFQLECPWLLAQQALKAMAAYRTPRDKVNCVVRCATSIMNLLSLAQDRGSTTADDFTPVLVYVIIMANPQDLLSTIEYVNSFYNNDQLQGEEQYWWTQFCAAVEYIKTMDYSD